MVTRISHSPDETEALGAQAAQAATEGMVFALSGDLGAGKTQWVRGFARGMGVPERVHSPTFSLINEYSGGRLPLFHMDLYRLDARPQIAAAGLEDYFSPKGITLIEWAEHWFSRSGGPKPSVWVTIESLSENERRITYEGAGY
jgi:tRNA threonylcarbamoyladenosine biosynthesis protein TsaE